MYRICFKHTYVYTYNPCIYIYIYIDILLPILSYLAIHMSYAFLTCSCILLILFLNLLRRSADGFEVFAINVNPRFLAARNCAYVVLYKIRISSHIALIRRFNNEQAHKLFLSDHNFDSSGSEH